MGDSDDYGNVSRNLRGCLGFAAFLMVVMTAVLTLII